MERQANSTLNRSARRRGEIIKFSWWKTPAIPVLLVLVILAWIPFFIQKQNMKGVLVGWGGYPGNCFVMVNTSELLKFSESYKMYGVCGVVDPLVDGMNDDRITVSSQFNISAGVVEIRATHQIAPLNFMATKNISIWYVIVLLPNNVSISQVRNLSDVQNLGGKVIGIPR